nr:hypothetical protein OG409_36955 [Streptomyces sp. NBC_00974]
MVEYRGAFKAAVVQAEPVWLDADAAIDKRIALIGEAARAGAQLIAFPETFIPGYPWWLWLDSPAAGFGFFARCHANSLTVNGPRFQRLLDAARSNAISVVSGYSERGCGSLSMGQVVVSAEGELIGTRRKSKPTHVERTAFGEGDGSDLAVYDTALGRVGALCCGEHLQPLTKYAVFSRQRASPRGRLAQLLRLQGFRLRVRLRGQHSRLSCTPPRARPTSSLRARPSAPPRSTCSAVTTLEKRETWRR